MGRMGTLVATQVRFPKIGENVEEGQVGRWHKASGSLVAEGEPLVELITDKATFDIESPASGVLLNILAPEKSIIPTNYILAILGADGASLVVEARKENEALMAAHKARAAVGWTASHDAGEGAAPVAAKIRATPAARRAAKAAGLRLEDVQRAFSDKVIDEEDVRRFLAGGKGGSTDAHPA